MSKVEKLIALFVKLPIKSRRRIAALIKRGT